LLYFETPSNPLLSVLDVRALATLAKDHELISMVDNTFASPINQNPLELGVDLVMHSGTKYLGGHSDLCFGALITTHALREALLPAAINWGGSVNANTCYQIERSLKTLSLRVQKQNENALFLAEALIEHPEISTVYYPGLESHPGHTVAASQMSGFGGMLSFELKKTGSAVSVCNYLNLIRPALSLGGVETIICIPSLTSHIKMSPQERLEAGVSDDLLRLSVGIEDKEDLWDDLSKALELIS
jgi:cystathionine beta-lyase